MNRIVKLVTGIALCLLLIIFLSNVPPLNQAVSKLLLTHILDLHEVEIKRNTDFLTHIRNIRNKVYILNNPTKNNHQLSFNHGKPLKGLLKLYFGPQRFFTCDVASRIMTLILDHYKIKSRFVTLATKGFFKGKFYQSHTLLEVYNPFTQKMILMDPFYSAEYICESIASPLNLDEALQCLKQGRALTWRHEAREHNKDIVRIEDLTTPLQDYFHAYKVLPLKISTNYGLPGKSNPAPNFYQKTMAKERHK